MKKGGDTMERVVYLLGAGFSAPLGLPVVHNFLERSKDLYFGDPEKHKHFVRIFETINELSVCKNYFTTDLFNIEDVLSLLDMRSLLTNEDETRKTFVQYIADVIRGCTPSNPGRTEGRNWLETLFGPEPWSYYGLFVATIFNHAFTRVMGRKHPNSIEYDPVDAETQAAEYAVITLNYDLVLESAAETLNNWFAIKSCFRRDFKNDPGESGFGGYLAKLHGSLDSGEIVPPTWNKHLSEGSVLRAWQIAHWLLENANHIRVIGYSLHDADTYIRYLLRAAIVQNPHLKTLDVLCLDPNGDVRGRYDEFVQFPNYRFKSAPVEGYLGSYSNSFLALSSWPPTLRFDRLEKTHRDFFASP
jgi:hypothetical protein